MKFGGFDKMKLSKNSLEYKYLKGNSELSIARTRHDLLLDYMSKSKDFKIAIHYRDIDNWSKWQSPIKFSAEAIDTALDIHRSMLDNEIILESDLENYTDNVIIMQEIGQILESKGYKPLYYYSGGKSIHCHIFLDFTKLFQIKQELQEKIINTFESKQKFTLEFMSYMRKLLISNFGLNNIPFDKAFEKSTHLVRMELSLNKKGFKTLVADTYKNIPLEPYICNFQNLEYPVASNIIESFDNSPESVIIDFLRYYEVEQQKRNLRAKMAHNQGEFKFKLRAGVKLILSDEFTKNEDGKKRSSFILCNELKQYYSADEAIAIILSWNAKFAEPMRESEIIYRIKSPNKYKLTTTYINGFLAEFGYKKEDIDKFR